jgi:ABC transporter DrrB family efflux protein
VNTGRATLLHAGRVFRRSLRMPEVVLQTVVVPVGLLFLLLAVFGEVVPTGTAAGLDRDTYASRLVVLMVLSSAVTGGIGSGTALIAERRQGLLSRFRTQPVPRVAPLAGRVLGDAARSLVGAVALVAVGHIIGFRFSAGPLGALGFFGLALLYASAFGWLVTLVALRARSLETVHALNPLFVLLLFVNGALVPVDSFPGWAQPLVAAAPHTAAVDALVGLAGGGPLLHPMMAMLAWVVGLTAVFAPLAVVSFHRASQA